MVEFTDGIVTLRPLSLGDASDHLAGDDEENVRWLSGAVSNIDTVTAWILRNQASWKSDGPIRNFGVRDTATDRLAGNIEAAMNYDNLIGVNEGEANVSYSIFPEWRGRGYAARAVDVLCGYLSGLGLRNAVIRVHPDNLRSIRVAEVALFRKTGIIENEDSGSLVRFERSLSPQE